MTRSLTILKLGGSVITRMTSRGPYANFIAINSLVREINSLTEIPVLVHGTGYFGKPPALEYDYHETRRLSKSQAFIVSSVSSSLEKLNRDILCSFRNRNIPSLPINIASLFRRENNTFTLDTCLMIQDLLERNIMPVISGGFVIDEGDGFAVCSSDIVAAHLAVRLRATHLIFITKAAGVYKNFGVNEEIFNQLTPDQHTLMPKSEETLDVSGGMDAKIQAGFVAARNNICTYIIDGKIKGNLLATLRNKPISGTRLMLN
jgi:isopentenyl phosphate kinase